MDNLDFNYINKKEEEFRNSEMPEEKEDAFYQLVGYSTGLAKHIKILKQTIQDLEIEKRGM